VKILSWASAALIVALNFWLVAEAATPWVAAAPWRIGLVGPVVLGLLGLLGWVAFSPARPAPRQDAHPGAAVAVAAQLPAPVYHRILVPLDHTPRDREAVAHAAAMARLHGAVIHLLHVEEGPISRLFGPQASTAEVNIGEKYFDDIVQSLAASGIRAELTVAHGQSPRAEIVRLANELRPDLLVMGAHGHSGIKDLIFGTTINAVRHKVAAPILVVGGTRSA
jgi:manganese transport protein